MCYLNDIIRLFIGKISLTSPIVSSVLTRSSLAVETKALLFLWLAHLNNKSKVFKQISSLLHGINNTSDCSLISKVTEGLPPPPSNSFIKLRAMQNSVTNKEPF